jgi:hypothetical protein
MDRHSSKQGMWNLKISTWPEKIENVNPFVSILPKKDRTLAMAERQRI